MYNTKEYALRYEKYPLYLKGTAMQIGLQILRNQNQLADTYLLYEEQRYLRNLSNKRVCPFYNRIRIYSLGKAGEEAE